MANGNGGSTNRQLTEKGALATSLYELFNEAWGPEGWSCTFSAVSTRPAAVVCLLEFAGVKRGGVGEGASLEEAALRALLMAAQLAGLEPRESEVGLAAGPKPSPQELIDKLVSRLRELGKGREAAALIIKYGGYGADPEATRKLYGELRALLVQKEEAAT